MKQSIVLANEQAIALYNYIQNAKLDRVKNRNRWKFLEVIEDKVFSYEETVTKKTQTLNDLQRSMTPDEESQRDVTAKKDKITEEIRTLAKEENMFVFNDREIFTEGKAFFEGSTEELQGQQSKLYKQIEDAFIHTKVVDESNN
ncbi:MAG TPA: hypothetical protein VEL70_06475 [Candidatus Acidoferrum sp.]|nr:hypothetical protein [Candidatus Acidoferrum sp.]